MPIEDVLNKTVKWYKRQSLNRYGKSNYSYEKNIRTRIEHQSKRKVDESGRDVTYEGAMMMVDANTILRVGDKVADDNRYYEVITVSPIEGISEVLHHEIELKRIDSIE